MRLRWLAATVLGVLALAAPGCGGSDETTSGTETVAAETTSTEETTEETTAAETTTSTTDSGVSGLLSEDCQELVGLAATFAEAFSATTGQPVDLDQQAQFFKDFAERVPEEIRDDYRIVAENFTKIADALKDVGPISAQSSAEELAEAIQKLQAATKDIDQTEVNAATARISAWAGTNCPAGG